MKEKIIRFMNWYARVYDEHTFLCLAISFAVGSLISFLYYIKLWGGILGF